MRKSAAVLLLMASSLLCAQDLPRNLVSFDTVVNLDVPNDTAYATLFIELSETDPSRLSEKVNQVLNDGVQQARLAGVMQSITTSYSTYPLYSKSNRQEGWRARGELKLNAQDFAALARLIGELQRTQIHTPLQLADVRYGVSDEARKRAEEKLLDAGMQVFRQRAAGVQKSMSSKGWHLLDLSINTQANRPPVPYRAAKAELSLSSAPPAAIEGGDTRLSVHIQSRIQLE